MDWIVVPLAGSSAALLGGVMLLGWYRRSRLHRIELERMSPRILVTGTRGKSSTVRLLHAMLAEADLRPWGRVTGTVTEEFTPDGEVLSIRRTGQHSVVELFDSVRRADQGGAGSLIFECMAVKPDLIQLTQEVFLRADISIITNVRADHLEDEGLDLDEIAHSLCAVADGARVVVTSEADPAIRRVLAGGIAERGGDLESVTGSDVDADVLGQLPGEHPDNVAICLAVAAHLGIDRAVALRGMRRSSHEPFAQEPSAHRVAFRSTEIVFTNLGTINDPESARRALDHAKREVKPVQVRVALIVSRWDRPLRSMQFAGFVAPSEFDAVLLAGALYRPMRRVLIKNGWHPNSVKPLRWIDVRSSPAFFARVCQAVPRAESAHVVELANIDPPIAERILTVLKPFLVSAEGAG